MDVKKQRVLRILSFFCIGAGVITVIPHAAAAEVSILGYKAICPFSPISTLIALYPGYAIHRYLGNLTQ